MKQEALAVIPLEIDVIKMVVDNALGIQSPCQMMIGVYNHLRNERYLGSITILRR